MKSFKNFSGSIAFILALATITSCDDDSTPNPDPQPGTGIETPVDPSNVFVSGTPRQAAGFTIKQNAKGQVSEILYANEKYVFSYFTTTTRTVNQTDYDMAVAVTGDERDDAFTFYFKLNEMGFVEFAYQKYADGSEPGRWWFKYNKEGQIVEMRRSEDYETTLIAYNNDGDIVNVEVSDGKWKDTSVIKYTDAQNNTPIENKGCIMLFDDCFDIDMDEMAPIYYAGLLGKATKNLPISSEETSTDDSGTHKETQTFSWTMNTNNLPIKFVSKEVGQPGIEEIEIFEW